MNFTLSASSNLPTGSTVKVFTRATFPSVPLVPQGAPPGSGEAFSGTMGASSLTVTGLAADTAYVATTSVGGVDRYVQFRTAVSVTGTLPTRTVTLTAQAYTTVAADHDNVLAVTTGATTATITLLAAATAGDGATLHIQKVDSGAGKVTVTDGSSDLSYLTAQYDIVELRSDGSAWKVISGRLARWRAALSYAYNSGTAAATGKYVRGIAIGSVNTNLDTAMWTGSQLAEHGSKFRVRAAYFSTGSSDPTSTLRASMYEVSSVSAGTTGSTLTLGTEIAASAVTGLAPTPRGTAVRGESTDFVIDPTKNYAMVLEVLTAAVPASTSVSGVLTLLAAD